MSTTTSVSSPAGVRGFSRLSRDDANLQARKEWPEPVVALGWWRGLLTLQGEEVVADVNKWFAPGYRDVPGSLFRRPGGRQYPAGWTVYDPVERQGVESLPSILDVQDTGLRSLERIEGSFFAPGGGGTLRALHDSGCECRRLDISIDFYGLEIDDFERAHRDGDFTGFRSAHLIDTRKVPGGSLSLYFGSRAAGGSFVRVYEKGGQQREPWACTRFELQAMHDDAAALFEELCVAEDPRSVAAGVLLRLDFREGLGRLRSQNHTARAKRCQWWQDILDRVGNMRPYDRSQRRIRDVERMVEWVKRAWPGTLGMLREMLGEDGFCRFLVELASCDAAKLDDFDRRLIQDWRESRSVDFI